MVELGELEQECCDILESNLGRMCIPNIEREYTLGIIEEIHRRLQNNLPFNDIKWNVKGDFRHDPRSVLVGRISELWAEILMVQHCGSEYELLPALGALIDSSGIDFSMRHRSTGELLTCQVKTLELIESEDIYLLNLYDDQFSLDIKSNRQKYDRNVNTFIIRIPKHNKIFKISYYKLRDIYDRLPKRPLGYKQYDVTKYLRGDREEGIELWTIPR